MRVLWISNIEIKDELSSSGSWIYGMAHALLQVKEVKLGNIVPVKTKKIIRSDFKTIQQWKIPQIKNESKVVLTNKDKRNVLDIISFFQPDIIHVWGIENGFALITPFVQCPVLIEIQGINSEISKYYFGGLSLKELIKFIRFKEIVTNYTIFSEKRKMAKMLHRELQIFAVNKYYTTATDWMQANVEVNSKKTFCFSNGFILRDEFYESGEWELHNNQIILTSASYVAPYKGLHVLLDAIAILKEKFPKIQLHIIGPYTKRGIRTSAYVYYLLNKIRGLDIENNIVWLGSLNAKEICKQIHKASVYVNSSFIESAGMTVLEAMALGIPIVSSFTGGIPSFNAGSIIYFSPGDYKCVAFQFSKTLQDKEIITSSSDMSRSYISKISQ